MRIGEGMNFLSSCTHRFGSRHARRHDLRGLQVGQQHTADFGQDFALQNAPLLVPRASLDTYRLRAEVLMLLLKRCTSVKTVRLCLRLGRELSLPWVGKLVQAVLPKGSARPWISKSKDGLLVLKP
jgi:Transcriptional regulator, AbiEi antitoxin, Type IV TA system